MPSKQPLKTNKNPYWPDPVKVLLVAVVLGMGAGVGIMMLSHSLDNKIQSIEDVESELGITFLGGVPYWVHSGLEKTIRPIVTEEFSTGATEAYRALRTSVLTRMEKKREKDLCCKRRQLQDPGRGNSRACR